MKISILASTILLLAVFTGCSDNAEEKNTKTESSTATTSTPTIEVVANENAQEVKVEEKVKTKIQVKNGKAYYYDYNIKSEYDENSQPANKDASVRVKPRTATDAIMNVRSPYEKVQVSLLARKLSKNFIVKCSACHNDYANGIIGPSLLAKNSDEIYNNIADFKSGKKSNPLMDGLIVNMSDNEIRKIADEIYTFNQELNKMRNK